MQPGQYRHTEVGWPSIGTLVVLALVFVGIEFAAEAWTLIPVTLAVLVAVALLFGTLTVQVDSTQIRFHFGIGLIRKRIDLAEVEYFRRVRNPWYFGWGIHAYPGGRVYNVALPWAEELILTSGKRIRIGTNDPDGLHRAIEQVTGKSGEPPPEQLEKSKRSVKRVLLFSAVIGVAIALPLGWAIHRQLQPPEVTVSAASFRVESLFYSEQFAIAEITHVSLEPRIPPIRARTNGAAVGSTLRGHFRLDHLGDGQLFIEHGVAPYLLVRRGRDWVIVNFEDPNRTRQLYQQLQRYWRGAAGEQLPNQRIGR